MAMTHCKKLVSLFLSSVLIEVHSSFDSKIQIDVMLKSKIRLKSKYPNSNSLIDALV